MRRLIMICILLLGCAPSFSWQVDGTWRVRTLDPVRDAGHLEQNGINHDQAYRYQIVTYDFTLTNKGRTKAEWVGVIPTLHPVFQQRIRNRFGLQDHPPLTLRPGAAGTVGADYILEGTQEEVEALAKQNRFQIHWRHNEQEMRQDIQPTWAGASEGHMETSRLSPMGGNW